MGDDVDTDALIQRDDEPVRGTEYMPPEGNQAGVQRSFESQTWEAIIYGYHELNKVHGWLLHIVAAFFPFLIASEYRIYDSYPNIVRWYTIFETVIGVISLSWIAILVGVVMSGGFNIEMNWTTDFVTSVGGVPSYATTLTNVGTMRVGWFFFALFLWKFIIWCGHMLYQKMFYRRLRNQFSYRYDLWHTISESITIPLFALTIAAAVGITNVFLLMAIVMMHMIYVIVCHYSPQHNSLKLAQIMTHFPTAFSVVDAEGNMTVAQHAGQTLQDSPINSMSGKVINSHMGGALRDPYDIGKVTSTILLEGLKRFVNPSDEENVDDRQGDDNLIQLVDKPSTRVIADAFNQKLEHKYDTAVRLAELFHHHRDMTLAVPLIVFLITLIITPITYFAFGTNTSGNTFQYYSYIPLWVFYVAVIIIDFFWHSFYWSGWNRTVYSHKQWSNSNMKVEASKLAINAFFFNMVRETVWTVAECVACFIMLGGSWNMPAPFTFFH